MPPQDPQQTPPPPKPTMHNPLAVMQPGEQVLFELKRHPIGLLAIYAATGVMVGILAFIALVVAPSLSTGSPDRVRALSVAGLLFFMILSVLFNLVETVVYWGNRWILTDDSITQISQTSLFHKETSSLELESLEDVTADQSGILSHIFNYGTLKAETAGHRSKFVFPFTPNPSYYAHQILEASEAERIKNRQRNNYAYPPPGQQQNSNSPTLPEQPQPPFPPA